MNQSWLMSIIAFMMLGGCMNMEPTDFKGASPRLVIEDYFAGETRAWGIFEDRFGNLRRQFTVTIRGRHSRFGFVWFYPFWYGLIFLN